MKPLLLTIALLFSTPAWAASFLRCDLDFSDRKIDDDDRYYSKYENEKKIIFVSDLTNGLSLNNVNCKVSDDETKQYYLCGNIRVGKEFFNIRLNRFDLYMDGKIDNPTYVKNNKWYTIFWGQCKFVKHLL